MMRIVTSYKTLLLPLTILLLAGCNTAREVKLETAKAIQSSVSEGIAERAEGQSELPNDVSNALLPPLTLQLPGIERNGPQQRFDIKVRNVNARDFFMGLVEGTPYNMVVHPKVTGRLSLDLKSVTVPETMVMVRSVYGYDSKQTENGYQVFPNTIHTRIYQVNYLSMQRDGRSMTVSNPGQASQGNGSSASSGSGKSRSGSGEGSNSSILSQSKADFWSELTASLETLIGASAGDGRRVITNPHSGLVMIRAMPNELRTVESYLEQSELVSKRQVVIEARILEVTLNDNYQSGINWGALQNGSSRGVVSLQENSGASFLNSSLLSRGTLGNTSDLVSSVSGGGAFTFGVNASNFSAFIDLLKTQGDVQVLSNPRVSTVNNQKAVIKVGNDEYFVTDINSDTTTGTATSTNIDVELTPFFTGVTLDVTPQISGNDEIILHIHPTITLVKEQIKQIESERGNLTMPLANSTVRETDSVVNVNDGEIVVLGGLIQNTVFDVESRVPLLGDIPGLGVLFRNTHSESQKTELVILLKPTIIKSGGGQWSNVLQESSERMQKIGGINGTGMAGEQGER